MSVDRTILYLTHNLIWNKFFIIRRFVSFACNWTFYIINQKMHVWDIKIYKRLVIIKIYRLQFFSFNRLFLMFINQIMTRKSDINRETQMFISSITIVIFMLKCRFFFAFYISKCLFLIVDINLFLYIL